MEAPIFTELLAVATKTPLIVAVVLAFIEPNVNAPVLLKVVAEPMVELDPVNPSITSKAVLAVFSVVVLMEPVIVIFPVCAPSVN